MKRLLSLLCLLPAPLQADGGLVHVHASLVSEVAVTVLGWEARADAMGTDARTPIVAAILPSGAVTDLTAQLGEWVDFKAPAGEAHAAR